MRIHVAWCRSCYRFRRKAHYEEYITQSTHWLLCRTQMISCLQPLKNLGSHLQDSKQAPVPLNYPSLQLSHLHCTTLFYMYQIDIFLRINETSFFPQLSVLFFNRKERGVHEIFSKKKMEMKMIKTWSSAYRIISYSKLRKEYFKLGNNLKMLSKSRTISCPIIWGNS